MSVVRQPTTNHFDIGELEPTSARRPINAFEMGLKNKLSVSKSDWVALGLGADALYLGGERAICDIGGWVALKGGLGGDIVGCVCR